VVGSTKTQPQVAERIRGFFKSTSLLRMI